jgi:hypothetical protein
MSSPTQSDPRIVKDAGRDAPGVEPWIKVALTAFVPLVLALYLPIGLQPYLFMLGGAIVLWSGVMLVREQSNDDPEVRE